MAVFTGMPRISDPPPYEYPLWAAHEVPSGYHWSVERVVGEEPSFELRLIAPQPFIGNARLALALSLRKWVVMAASLERLGMWLGPDRVIYMDGGGWDTCALCMCYIRDAGCSYCPIFAETGERLCGGTPYVDWRKWGSASVDELLRIAEEETAWLRRLQDKLGGCPEEITWPERAL